MVLKGNSLLKMGKYHPTGRTAGCRNRPYNPYLNYLPQFRAAVCCRRSTWVGCLVSTKVLLASFPSIWIIPAPLKMGGWGRWSKTDQIRVAISSPTAPTARKKWVPRRFHDRGTIPARQPSLGGVRDRVDSKDRLNPITEVHNVIVESAD